MTVVQNLWAYVRIQCAKEEAIFTRSLTSCSNVKKYKLAGHEVGIVSINVQPAYVATGGQCCSTTTHGKVSSAAEEVLLKLKIKSKMSFSVTTLMIESDFNQLKCRNHIFS